MISFSLTENIVILEVTIISQEAMTHQQYFSGFDKPGIDNIAHLQIHIF